MMMMSFYAALTLLLLAVFFSTASAMTEEFRLQEHDKRYSREWPPENYVPATPGWKKLMDERFRQVAEIDDLNRRYEGYMQTATPALATPNFTEHGFGLVRAPEDLTAALREGVMGAYEQGKARLEHDVEVIEGPRCLFVDRPDLTKRVLEELQPYTETWAQMKLTPAIAYGFRIYQKGAILNMHVDKPQTHVISMIYHVFSEKTGDDGKEHDWPLLIEDLNGNTHEVYLSPGDVLFYESSKCLHGRPMMFNGTAYSSIFIHYYPSEGWAEIDHHKEGHYAIPAGWNVDIPPEEKIATPLVMLGTSFKEPSCPNSWCRSQNTIKWYGPAKEGLILAPDKEIPFTPKLHDEL